MHLVVHEPGETWHAPKLYKHHMPDVPPPFQPQPNAPNAPRPGPNPLILVGAVLAGLCCVCGGGTLAMVQGMKGTIAETVQCGFRAGATKSVITTYAKQKGVYPSAASWQDDIKVSYSESYNMLSKAGKSVPMLGGAMEMNPPGTPITCDSKSVTTGIVYNEALDGKKVNDPSITPETVVLYESNKVGYNQHGPWPDAAEFKGPVFEGKARQRVVIKVKSNAEVSTDTSD